MAKAKTEVVFLGGNNKDRIGGNCIVVEHTNSDKKTARVMFDMGSVFTPSYSGFDEAFVDCRKYFNQVDKETGVRTEATHPINMIVFTHLHQDHIGALNHLKNLGFELPVISASRNTRNFIRISARENGVELPDLQAIKSKDVLHITPDMEIEAFDVAHSAVDSLGFHVLTKDKGEPIAGLLNHGDFYTEENMPVGAGFDKNAYRDLLKRKLTTHALIDSTSISSSKKPRLSFEDAVSNCLSVVHENSGKQIISPVISRSLQNIAIDVEVARRLNRKICLDGKWLKHAYEAMQLSGYKDFEDVVSKQTLKEYLFQTPVAQRYIVCTGAFSQGMQEYRNNEGKGNLIPMASFTKMALDIHEQIHLNKDTLLLSRQRIITEINGKYGLEALNLAAAQGAKVYAAPSQEVNGKFRTVEMQGSGHLNLLALKELVQKGVIYIPIHGNFAQLDQTAEAVRKLRGRAYVADNMNRISLSAGSTRYKGQDDQMQWIAVENQTQDPLNPDPNIPIQGKKTYYVVDENYQKIEKLAEVDNQTYLSRRDPHDSKDKAEKAKVRYDGNPLRESNKMTKVLNQQKNKKFGR